METGEIGALIRLAVFLPLVLILLYFFLRYGLGRQGPRVGGQMQLLDRLPLGPKASLCVVAVAGRIYLLGVSEDRVELLSELPAYEANRDGPLPPWATAWRDRWQKLQKARQGGPQP